MDLVIILHDDIIKRKYFPRYWPFVWGIHRSPINSPHKGQWRGALMFSLIYAWINRWVNNREAGFLRRHRTHYDVIVMVRDIPGKCIAGNQTYMLFTVKQIFSSWWRIFRHCTEGRQNIWLSNLIGVSAAVRQERQSNFLAIGQF